MYTFQMHVWPSTDLEEFQVYELEVDVGWWTLTQRVHLDDLPNAMRDAVQALLFIERPDERDKWR
jgi:UDP-N-acetylmuramyl tripeptide synthase